MKIGMGNKSSNKMKKYILIINETVEVQMVLCYYMVWNIA